jgi:glycosyltransferase involved in cell wall biosynthesis
LTVHNHLTTSESNADQWKQRLSPRVMEAFSHEADHVIAVSKGVARDLSDRSGLAPDRIKTIYNPVFTPEIWKRAEEAPEHRWFCEEIPVVLAVGKLKKQKDFATLIRAFARLRARRPVRLVILGEGPEREALRSLVTRLRVERDVDLLGFRENPFSLMRRASVFALSSAWEGFGNVLVEAMACGAPVVSTRCPSGPEEILDDGRYGRLVPVGDPGAFCDALEATIDVAPDRSILQRRAQVFSRDTSVRHYEALLFPPPRPETP